MTSLVIRCGVVLALVLLAMPPPAAASVPTKMAFTGRIADGGTPATGTHTFVFRLFAVAAGGTPLWEESQPGVAVNAGVVTTTLGTTTPIPQSLFGGGALYLEVTYDSTTLSPRMEVASVAYAMRANEADRADYCDEAGVAEAAATVEWASVLSKPTPTLGLSLVCTSRSSSQAIDAMDVQTTETCCPTGGIAAGAGWQWNGPVGSLRVGGFYPADGVNGSCWRLYAYNTDGAAHSATLTVRCCRLQ